MSQWSWLLKGYLIWSLSIGLWFTSAAALGWRMPPMGFGAGGSSVRSGGGVYPHSSWSFGK